MQATIHSRLRELLPEPSASLNRAYDLAYESTDPSLLELCRCRVAQILDVDAVQHSELRGAAEADAAKLAALDDWANSSEFSPLERAALDYTEQYVISVNNISDDQVDALRAHLDDAAVYAFAAALYLVEMTERLRLVSSRMFGEDTAN
jgi:alkylhydroperoxidase family enzyme